MKKYFKKIHSSVVILLKLLGKDSKRSFTLPLKVKWFAWSRGFLPENYIIYNFIKNNPKDYINDFIRLSKSALINKQNAILLDYKHLFSHFLMYEKRVVQPELYVAKRKVIKFNTGLPFILGDEFDNFLKQKLVIKPTGGGGGTDIFFINYRDKIWELNGKPIEYQKLIKFIYNCREVLIYKYINQTGFAHEVNPHSLNTIRILTMIEPKSNKSFLAAAVFRCGVAKSGQVDNWSSGGLSVQINLETGEMGMGVTFPHTGKLTWLINHPDSGVPLMSKKIPEWENLKQEVLNLAQRLFFIPYIAWDIVPMDSDFFILEANSNTDVNLLQVHEPLLKSFRVQDFYRYHKVI